MTTSTITARRKEDPQHYVEWKKHGNKKRRKCNIYIYICIFRCVICTYTCHTCNTIMVTLVFELDHVQVDEKGDVETNARE